MTIHDHEKFAAGTAAAAGDAPSRPAPGTARHHFTAALNMLEKIDVLDPVALWPGVRQAAFLAALTDGATVAEAAEKVGVSARSAYSFRKRIEGECFDLGWRAASLLARDKLHDVLVDRAFNGQVWTVTRTEGENVVETSRRRFDNRLSLAMLARLDKQADDAESPQLHAAQLIAGDFDGFLARIALGSARDTIVDFLRDRHSLAVFDFARPPPEEDDDWDDLMLDDDGPEKNGIGPCESV